VPATASNTVPQLQLPDGRIVHDSTEIIAAVEALCEGSGAQPVVPPTATRPRQRLACELIEMLGDEWLLPAAYHWRWAYSGNGTAAQRMPRVGDHNHRALNEEMWGRFLHPRGRGPAQRATGAFLFDNIMFRVSILRLPLSVYLRQTRAF